MNTEALRLTPSAAAVCPHCGSPLGPVRSDGFCCAGCRAVYRLLNDSGLRQYYALRPSRTKPLLDYFASRPSLGWLDQAPGAAAGRLELSVEGIQCGACVWAMETLARRHGGAQVGVNSALGRLSLSFEPVRFDVKGYLSVLADLGYRVRPLDGGEDEGKPGRALLLRLGVCAAVAMNTMLLSLPYYLGLKPDSDGLYQGLRRLEFCLSLCAVAYGGSYFFTRAWKALRQGVAHFDIPVALGVAAAFTGSCWAYWRGQVGAIYFDSVDVFLALMLAGRVLQERELLAQRRALLKSDAFDQTLVTRLDLEGPRDAPFPTVRSGDRLLLQPGSLCPAEAELLDEGPLEFDRAAVTGEARPVQLRRGEAVAAGARLVSGSAARVLCTAPFSAGLLARLSSPAGAGEEAPVLWRWAVRWYVALVLGAAFAGGLWWALRDPQRAPSVFVAVLVVTCPCGLGIAIPLARSLADRRLAACGLTVRRPGLLERLNGVRRVCLDKTGTLTFSHLELADPGRLDGLAPEARRALMGAAASSRHPVSRSLFRELSARGEAFPEEGRAEEIPGLGVVWRDARGGWFLGRSLDPGAARATLHHDGRAVASFELTERVLEDAASALRALKAMGLDLLLLSGDDPGRVAAMAAGLGLEPAQARGGQSPDDKAAAMAETPTLMLGDGLNDGPALGAALASGTPAWERTVVADGADFAFASASLAWLPAVFATARTLRRVLWGNLAFAAAYNVVLLGFALTGRFSPLACAVTMPTFSLLVTAATARSMRP